MSVSDWITVLSWKNRRVQVPLYTSNLVMSVSPLILLSAAIVVAESATKENHVSLPVNVSALLQDVVPESGIAVAQVAPV